MKLGELRGAIRKFKGNPIVNLYPIPSSNMGMKVALQKTPLLAELERVYPGGKSVETGFVFNESTGVLSCPERDAHEGLTQDQKTEAFAGSELSTEPALDLPDADVINGEDTFNENLIDDDDDIDLDDDDLDLDLD